MKFKSPREELKVSLEKIKDQLIQQNHYDSSHNDEIVRDIFDAIQLSKEQQSQAINKFNQLLAQKKRRSS